jgi:hypothetical protein
MSNFQSEMSSGVREETAGRLFEPAVHRLWRDAFGRLVFTDEHGHAHEGIVPSQPFPIEAPGENVSLLDGDGHELAYVASIAELDADSRKLLMEEIAQRDFIPVIDRLLAVSSFATPSTWQVRTDRGPTSFILKGEEDIRRLRGNGLLITDNHGVTYRIEDMRSMDRLSRRLLDRFL